MKHLEQLRETALQQTIEQGNEDGYISWDGLLDICDEDKDIYDYVIEQLETLHQEDKIDFELDW